MKKYVEDLWKKANRAALLLQLAPFVRLVAVTGSLERGEAKPDSDADLFIVTEPKRLYTARAFVLLILKFTGQRINVEAGRVAGAVDPNYWLSGDNLDLKPHNAYVARDYSYMLPLWDACDIYFKIVDANSWLAEYNLSGRERKFRDVVPSRQYWILRAAQRSAELLCRPFGPWLERWARSAQEARVREFAARQGKQEKVVVTDSELRFHL